MKTTVEITSVSKSFGPMHALDDVSLTVIPGETLALLGHNGAGKTTLFRILLGFIEADSGHATIDGVPAGSGKARRALSFLPENVAFPKMLTGREVVELYATLKGADRGRVAHALERVGLGEASSRRCGTYSKGMRQRLGIAQAIVGNPAILLLDEPTSGLDPVSRAQFYELMSELAAQGSSVLLSSHGLSELEAKTDRMAILRNGRLVADGSLALLQRRAQLPIRIRVKVPPGEIEVFYHHFGGRRINGASVELLCTQDNKMPLLSQIHQHAHTVSDIEVIPPSLDEVYRHFSSMEPAQESST